MAWQCICLSTPHVPIKSSAFLKDGEIAARIIPHFDQCFCPRPLDYFFIEQNHYGVDNASEYFTVVSSPTRKDFIESGEVVILDEYNKSVVEVKIPRRQAPGWDGCRDSYEGIVPCENCHTLRFFVVGASSFLPNELQWLRPSQRAWHQVISR